jgi:SAM-dependent methyltransferase
VTDRGERGYWARRERYAAPDATSARAFAVPKARAIAEALALTGRETVLDVGAGTGHLGEAFRARGHRVVALDASWNMLRKNPAPVLCLADAARLPFPDGAFDVAVEANLLHHLPDAVAALREMARVSRLGVGVVEPNRYHPPMALFSLLVPEERRGLRFCARHVRRLAESAGLSPLFLVAAGWVYQNRTPAAVARFLSRFEGPCPAAAYVVGAFRTGRTN